MFVAFYPYVQVLSLWPRPGELSMAQGQGVRNHRKDRDITCNVTAHSVFEGVGVGTLPGKLKNNYGRMATYR